MDEALACHTGGRGLNPDTPKFIVLLTAWVPPPHALSLRNALTMLQREYLSQGERNHGKILAAPSVRQNMF